MSGQAEKKEVYEKLLKFSLSHKEPHFVAPFAEAAESFKVDLLELYSAAFVFSDGFSSQGYKQNLNLIPNNKTVYGTVRTSINDFTQWYIRNKDNISDNQKEAIKNMMESILDFGNVSEMKIEAPDNLYFQRPKIPDEVIEKKEEKFNDFLPTVKIESTVAKYVCIGIFVLFIVLGILLFQSYRKTNQVSNSNGRACLIDETHSDK